MWTNEKETILYIEKLCSRKILRKFFAMKPSGVWRRQTGLMIDNLTVFQVSLNHQIDYLKRCVDRKVDSEVLKDKITLGMLADTCRFRRSKEYTELLWHILRKNRCAMLKQHFKKVEDDNLMLKQELKKAEDDNLMLKQELKKAEDKNIVLVARSGEYSRKLLQVQERNGELCGELNNMGNLHGIYVKKVEAYGEGVQLNKVTDESLECIGMKIGKAMGRWKEEHVKRKVSQQLSANPDFTCPITQDILVDPVIASDGHTYERHALVNWINRGGTSPITRKFICILRDNDPLKNYIESTRARLEREIYDNC